MLQAVKYIMLQAVKYIILSNQQSGRRHNECGIGANPGKFMTPARLTCIRALIKDKVVFPDVRDLIFSDTAPAYRGALQLLATRLPRLEKYDHRRLSGGEERGLHQRHLCAWLLKNTMGVGRTTVYI
jgi:hypothetical protein